MQRLLIHLSVAALLLASASFAFAQRTAKSYIGVYNGAPCTAQLAWHNWKGLGPVDGRIKLASGATVAVSGSNSATGVLDLSVNGAPIRLVRSSARGKTSWVSSTLSLTEGVAPTPTPSPSPTPIPGAVADAGDLIIDQTYTGTWKGKAFTAQMRWAPGDTPEVLRRGAGTMTLEDGTQVSIEGSQPSADAAEFSLTANAAGSEVHKTTKAASADGKAAWESGDLKLIEKK
jgi:hypothetical protein